MTNQIDYDIINTQDKRTALSKTRKEITMAVAMKMADIQREVKTAVFEQIKALFAESGEQFGDFEIAVPVTVDGAERWAKVSVVCGQLKDTKSAPAFDPFVVQSEWLADKEIKAKEAEAKAKAKADKIARSKSKAKAKSE